MAWNLLNLWGTECKSWSKFKGLRNRSIDIPEQEKINVPVQGESKLTIPPLFFFFFCSIKALKGLVKAHPHW